MGQVFAIKKYAIHDGPSIRTTVFFKGCPLRCVWCHNPEGISGDIERIWVKNRCIACGQCLEECRSGALGLEKGEIIRDMGLCTGCGLCLDICPALAHDATARQMTVPKVMEEIIKDIPFYDQSGGGVTFSGGEPLSQPGFLLDLLRACKNLSIHTAVDTCAHAGTGLLEEIAGHTDLFLIDIKHMDHDTHKRFTGVPNQLILENIRFLASMKKQIRFRIPLIKGVNCDPETIEEAGRFIANTAPASRVDLLTYHEMARAKYEKLGKDFFPFSFEKPDKNEVGRLAGKLAALGLNVGIGG